MNLFEYAGKSPVIAEDAWIAPTATIIGDVTIGPGASIWYGAVLEEEALVGNGCVVLDGARIGARSLIAAMSLVQPGMQIPPGVLAAGVPAVVKREIAGTSAEFWVTMNPVYYPELAIRHRNGIRRIEPDRRDQ